MQIPAQIREFLPKKGTFIRDYWYVFVFGFFAIILIFAQAIKLLTPQIPIQENTWNNITPGYSTTQNMVEILGQPISQEQTDFGVRYSYESEFPTIPTKVETNLKQKVVFIKQRVAYDPELTLNKLQQNYGNFDFEINVPESHGAIKAFVFLQKGVAVIAHIADQSIEQVWYFEPTSKEKFLQNWGQNLSDQESTPEEFEFGEN